MPFDQEDREDVVSVLAMKAWNEAQAASVSLAGPQPWDPIAAAIRSPIADPRLAAPAGAAS